MINTSTSMFFLLFQLLNIALLVLWPVLTLIALFQIRGRRLSNWLKFAWTLVVILPILGPIAFFIVSPQEEKLE